MIEKDTHFTPINDTHFTPIGEFKRFLMVKKEILRCQPDMRGDIFIGVGVQIVVNREAFLRGLGHMILGAYCRLPEGERRQAVEISQRILGARQEISGIAIIAK